jgi:membrane protease YdiL (CAAX protease family)
MSGNIESSSIEIKPIDVTSISVSNSKNNNINAPQIDTSSNKAPSKKKLPNKPWSAKGTLGITFLLFIIANIMTIVSMFIFTSIQHVTSWLSSEGTDDIKKGVTDGLTLDGDFMSFSYILTALCLSPMIVYFAKQRKLTTTAAYLGFDKLPSKKSFIYFNLALLTYFVITYFTSNMLSLETPQSMIDIYSSTDYFILLIIAVVIAAPIFEELLFRGFMFTGLKHSPLGIIGTIIITSILFTLIHGGQYELIDLALLFPLAVILGLARHRSGGIYLPIYLHFMNNLLASIDMYFMMN